MLIIATAIPTFPVTGARTKFLLFFNNTRVREKGIRARAEDVQKANTTCKQSEQ